MQELCASSCTRQRREQGFYGSRAEDCLVSLENVGRLEVGFVNGKQFFLVPRADVHQVANLLSDRATGVLEAKDFQLERAADRQQLVSKDLVGSVAND